MPRRRVAAHVPFPRRKAQSPDAVLMSGRAVQFCVACLCSNPKWRSPRPFPVGLLRPAGTKQHECLTALSTASIADIDQVIQELQILRDDKATKEAGKPAPLTREEQLACTFPDKGKVGMMKGGKLGKGGGYSEKTRTFPACRDGQYCRCALGAQLARLMVIMSTPAWLIPPVALNQLLH